MATTTPNYGWAVPTSTDLVKDGATAIETLGDAIDASMNTALGTKKAGMILLNTTSFSAVASQSINNVFSSTYKNYRIVVNITQTTGASGQIIATRLRVGGVSASGSDYAYSRFGYSFPGSLNNDAGGTTSTSFFINRSNGSGSIDGESVSDVTFYAPFLAERTFVTGFSTDGLYNGSIGGYHNSATSYDGIEILPTTGATTITGSVSVYGFNV
jgi:hypothetical protein